MVKVAIIFVMIFSCLCQQLAIKAILFFGCPTVRGYLLKVCECSILWPTCRN